MKAFVFLRKATQRVAARLGLKGHSVSKQTRHLDYNHPSMVAVREWVQMMVSSDQVEPRLMAHFDQVWSAHYEPARHVLFKEGDKKGLCKEKSNPSTEKMLQSLRQALHFPSEEGDAKGNQPAQPPSLCAQSTLVPVENQRQARTVTTLSFADGSMGRAYITASQSILPGPQRL